MTRITGETARELLRDATPGPWDYREDSRAIMSYSTEHMVQIVGEALHEGADGPLLAAAPELAATIQWLYGRECDRREGMHETEAGWVIPKRDGIAVSWEDNRITPDEAVDLARALLSAAEEASRDQ